MTRSLILTAAAAVFLLAPASVAQAPAEEAPPWAPVNGPGAATRSLIAPFTAPSPGSGSYLALGELRNGPLPLDAATGDDGHLGIARLGGWFWVSGRGTQGTAPVGFHAIYQFDDFGGLVAIFPQTSPGGSLWGHRDLASDETTSKLWGGEELGYLAEYDFDPGAGPTGTLTFNTAKTFAGVGTIRALARNPSAGSFFTADFVGPIYELDFVTGTVILPIPNPGKAITGLAWDWWNDSIWSFSQDNMTGTVHDRVEFNAVEPLTGALLGPKFEGINSQALGLFNLSAGVDIYEDPAFPDSLTIVGMHQAWPDDIVGYDLDVALPMSPESYCTAKPGLSCGLPSIVALGTSSASATSGFVISSTPARGNKQGVMLYGSTGMVANPFNGGFVCVASPIKRALQISSGGTSGQCDGLFSTDLNAFATGALGGNPAGFLQVPGTIVYTQWWGRDTFSGGNYLSDALLFEIWP